MRALIAAVALVVALTACSAGSAEPSPTDGAPEPPAPSEPDRAAAMVTEEPGPIEAAVSYVASTDQLAAHSPIGRGEIFRRLLVPSAVTEQAEAFEAAATSLAETLGITVDRLTWVEAPLTATLLSSDAERATVDVWTVSVLGAPDAGPPQQAWRTVHVELELVDGTWMVSGATADAGPTPQSNELSLPASFDEFSVVAGWPAAVEGVGL